MTGQALQQLHETVMDPLATHDALVAAREHEEWEL